MAAFQRELIDAALPFEPAGVMVQQAGKGRIYLNMMNGEIPEFRDILFIVLATHPDIIKEKPELMRKVALVFNEAMPYPQDRPQARQGAMAKEYPTMTPETNEQAYETVSQIWPPNGRITEEQARATFAYLQPTGTVPIDFPHLHQRVPAEISRSEYDSWFSVGKATIARVEETYGPTYPPRDIFPDWNDDILAEHAHWLAPNHYDPASRPAQAQRAQLAAADRQAEDPDRRLLRQQQGQAGAAVLAHAGTPYLERLAAAGARPHEIDLVMCTHLHHDHVGWNTQLKDGRWVPTFPNARYVISKPDFEYFQKLDADPQLGPAEQGTFRECVLPIVEAGRADLVTGPHRLNDHLEIVPAPGHSAGHVVFKLESGGQRAAFIGDVFHHLLQVFYPHWNFPKNSDAEQARASRRMVLEDCAVDRRAGAAGPRRRAVRRPHRGDRRGICAAVLMRWRERGCARRIRRLN